jgi:glutamine cyclotransferase
MTTVKSTDEGLPRGNSSRSARALFVAIAGTMLWLGGCGPVVSVSALPSLPTVDADGPPVDSIPVLNVRIVKVFPHDSKAFTQGLEFYGGFLYESTGLKGHSSLRKVAIAQGQVLQSVSLAPEYFGEGLTIFGKKIYQLTWLSKTGFIYDLRSFRKTGEFHYQSEGWGLTHDDQSLILSDGSNQLQFIDPATFRVQRRLEVYAGREAVANLNELEYIRGMIYANIWHSPRIARIDPHTGQVTAWIDLREISAKEEEEPEAVLNGIAYDADGDRLFVTGKNWAHLFQIKIEEK